MFKKGSRRMRSIFVILLALLLIGGATYATTAQEASPVVGESLLGALGLPELRITVAEDGAITAPSEIEGGRYLVVVEVAASEMFTGADLTLVQVPPGMTLEEMAAQDAEAGEGVAPAWFYETAIAGGTFALPGTSSSFVTELTEGEWRVEVFIESAEGDQEASPVAIEATPAALEERVDFEPTMMTVTDAATAIVAVDVPVDQMVEAVDFNFTIPDSVAAGPQIWQVTNTGAQPHHVIVEKAPGPITEEQIAEVLALEFGMGETGATPSADLPSPDDFMPAGGLGVISSGQTAWIELNLDAGTYIAICFIPDQETGMPHAAMGMYEVFTVD
jgi:hypothetical protein